MSVSILYVRPTPLDAEMYLVKPIKHFIGAHYTGKSINYIINILRRLVLLQNMRILLRSPFLE